MRWRVLRANPHRRPGESARYKGTHDGARANETGGVLVSLVVEHGRRSSSGVYPETLPCTRPYFMLPIAAVRMQLAMRTSQLHVSGSWPPVVGKAFLGPRRSLCAMLHFPQRGFVVGMLFSRFCLRLFQATVWHRHHGFFPLQRVCFSRASSRDHLSLSTLFGGRTGSTTSCASIWKIQIRGWVAATRPRNRRPTPFPRYLSGPLLR